MSLRDRLPSILPLAGPVCAAVLGAGSPAVAAMDMHSREPGCVAVLTVQKHGCHVETYYRCPDVGVGYFRQETYDLKGLHSVRHYSQWRTNPLAAQILRENASAAPDARRTFSAEATELVVAGTAETAEAFPELQQIVQVRGMLLTQGELDEIQGNIAIPMQFFAMLPGAGGGAEEMYAEIWYLSELDVEIYGESRLGSRRLGHPVAQIIRPGAPGFGSETPAHDCRLLSALDGLDGVAS